MHAHNQAFCDAMSDLNYTVVGLDGVTPVAHADDNVHALCEPNNSIQRGTTSR